MFTFEDSCKKKPKEKHWQKSAEKESSAPAHLHDLLHEFFRRHDRAQVQQQGEHVVGVGSAVPRRQKASDERLRRAAQHVPQRIHDDVLTRKKLVQEVEEADFLANIDGMQLFYDSLQIRLGLIAEKPS